MAENSNILIPELILRNALQSILTFIKEDDKNNANVADTFLHSLFSDTKDNKFTYLKEARDLFLRTNGHEREVKVFSHFNKERIGVPSIHITTPAESTIYNSLGIDEGLGNYSFDSDNTEVSPIYTRSFKTNFNIIITSDNMSEVLLMYHTLRAGLISIMDHLVLSGLQDIKIGGNPINIREDLVPVHVMSRGLSIEFFYEVSVNRSYGTKIINQINLVGKPLKQ